MGEVRDLPLTEEDYFVLKFADGTYFNSNFRKFNGKISEALRYENISDTIQDKYMLVKLYGLDVEIVPVTITIAERKKRDILCYLVNPQGNGWCFRTDSHLKVRWSIIGADMRYPALTD